MTSGKLLWVLSAMFSLQLCTTLFLPSFKGSIHKQETYNLFYVGDNLTLLCVKNSPFTGEAYFMQGALNISNDYVTQINETHAVMSKPVTGQDFAKSYYTCMDEGVAVAATLNGLFTDYPPQNASDLEMVWLNEQVLIINCSFSNTTYKHSNDASILRVIMEWRSGETGDWQECYTGSVAGKQCNVTDIGNVWAEVQVRVNLTNQKRDDTASTVFPPVQIRQHVKPLPVETVTVTAVNSTTAKVTVTAANMNLAYNITYQSEEEGVHFMVINRTADKSFEIAGLHPHYNYTFEVRSKYEVNRGYLSDPPPSIPDLQMPEDAPAAAPVVTPGSFLYGGSDCETGTTVTAYVYFQELADSDKNGVIVEYSGTVVGAKRNTTSTQKDGVATLKLVSVPCGGDFTVAVQASTAVGPSPASFLHVSAQTEDLDSMVNKLKLRLRSEGINVWAEWEPVDVPQGMSFLLYYCTPNSADIAMCQNSISHVDISRQSSPLLLQSADANMKFGVAAIANDGSTNGIRFTDCVYDPKKGVNMTCS